MNAETLKELLANATSGPWIYRPDKYDDWGTVKSGQFHICQARNPRYLDDKYLNACRGDKRDPWEANARLIALAPQLAADNIAMQAEVERLHEIVEDLEEKLRQERDALKTMKPLW